MFIILCCFLIFKTIGRVFFFDELWLTEHKKSCGCRVKQMVFPYSDCSYCLQEIFIRQILKSIVWLNIWHFYSVAMEWIGIKYGSSHAFDDIHILCFNLRITHHSVNLVECATVVTLAVSSVWIMNTAVKIHGTVKSFCFWHCNNDNMLFFNFLHINIIIWKNVCAYFLNIVCYLPKFLNKFIRIGKIYGMKWFVPVFFYT